MLKGQKILVTGVTGQVTRPIAEALARDNEVWCAARFGDPEKRAEIERLGMKTCVWTLDGDDFSDVPDDFDYVIHGAAAIFDVATKFDDAIRLNAEGTGLLMAHCRKAKAFLQISTMSVYSKIEDNSQPRKIDDALGCHTGYSPSYSIAKVSTEAVVRTMARQLSLPTIICRLGVAYGIHGHGGVPTMVFEAMKAGNPVLVPPDGKSYLTLLYEQDFVKQVPALLEAATVPATIINWCGDEVTDEAEMVRYIAAISGLNAKLEVSDEAGYYGGMGDISGRKAITGPCQWGWREGVLDALRRRFPEHEFQETAEA